MALGRSAAGGRPSSCPVLRARVRANTGALNEAGASCRSEQEAGRAASFSKGMIMAGVDFGKIRTTFPVESALEKLECKPTHQRGTQLRGPCPVCGRQGRCLSANAATNRYFCHGCKSCGNVLELWMAVTALPIHQAAIDLCRTFGRQVPVVKRW